ncbi:MAG: tetratricopeptide repeat protein [Planctomycetota bacterium]
MPNNSIRSMIVVATLAGCASPVAADPPPQSGVAVDRESDPRALIDEAFRHLQEGRAERALQVLDQLEAIEPLNPWLWYLRGMSEQQRFHFQSALAHFDRALEELERSGVEDDALESAIRNHHVETRRRLFSFDWQFGLAYDTNVSFLEDAAAQPGLIAGEDDGKFMNSMSLRVSLWESPTDHLWLEARTAQSWHFAVSEFDYQNYGGTLHYSRLLTEQLKLSLAYEYDYEMLDRDSFGSFQAGTAALSWRYDPWVTWITPLESVLFYRLESQDFHFPTEQVFDQDALSQQFGVSHSIRIQPFDEKAYHVDLRGSYRFGHFDTDGTEFDRREHTFGFGLSAPLRHPGKPEAYLLSPTLPLLLHFDVQWESDDFLRSSVVDRDGRRRYDHVMQYDVVLSQTLFDDPRMGRMIAHFVFSYTDTNSNVIADDRTRPYAYDKAVYGLQFHWAW